MKFKKSSHSASRWEPGFKRPEAKFKFAEEGGGLKKSPAGGIRDPFAKIKPVFLPPPDPQTALGTTASTPPASDGMTPEGFPFGVLDEPAQQLQRALQAQRSRSALVISLLERARSTPATAADSLRAISALLLQVEASGKRLTMPELARRACLPLDRLRRLLRGRVGNPSLREAMRLALALRLSLDGLAALLASVRELEVLAHRAHLGERARYGGWLLRLAESIRDTGSLPPTITPNDVTPITPPRDLETEFAAQWLRKRKGFRLKQARIQAERMRRLHQGQRVRRRG